MPLIMMGGYIHHQHIFLFWRREVVLSCVLQHIRHPTSQFVNRDWRWDDARNSTITFSEDEESGIGAEAGGGGGKMDKEKKRRSVKMGKGPWYTGYAEIHEEGS
jgi:hypothetical protein